MLVGSGFCSGWKTGNALLFMTAQCCWNTLWFVGWGYCGQGLLPTMTLDPIILVSGEMETGWAPQTLCHMFLANPNQFSFLFLQDPVGGKTLCLRAELINLPITILHISSELSIFTTDWTPPVSSKKKNCWNILFVNGTAFAKNQSSIKLPKS